MTRMAWFAGLRRFPWSPITGFGLILTLVLAGVVLILPGIGQLSILDREEAALCSALEISSKPPTRTVQRIWLVLSHHLWCINFK